MIAQESSTLLSIQKIQINCWRLRGNARVNHGPSKGTEKTQEFIKREIQENKYQPNSIAYYFGADANANLFKTKVIGAELYRSEDYGMTWKKMNSYDLDGVFFTYGYYFAEMKVSPTNPDQIY